MDLPDGEYRKLSELGWKRIHETPTPLKEAATANVMRTFAINRPYVNLLDPVDMAAMVINQLLYDGWTLTPPKEPDDERADNQRDRREGGS